MYDRPELSCVEDLAGGLYVLEGACLGGQVLSPLLHRRLGLTKGSGAAFFAGDEESTLPRWTLFVAWVDGLPRTGASTTKIIRAATGTLTESVELIRRSTMRMKALIDDLLELETLGERAFRSTFSRWRAAICSKMRGRTRNHWRMQSRLPRPRSD